MSAPARGPLRPADWLRQQHEVETPEHVELRLELAGVGSRTAAVALDSLILNGVLLLTAIVLSSVFSLDSVAGDGGLGTQDISIGAIGGQGEDFLDLIHAQTAHAFELPCKFCIA